MAARRRAERRQRDFGSCVAELDVRQFLDVPGGNGRWVVTLQRFAVLVGVLSLAHYAVSGAGYHPLGEPSTVSLTALDSGFAGCLCGVA